MKFFAKLRKIDQNGTNASRRLRHNGYVPAVVYGGNESAIGIFLDHKDIYHALKQEEFHASLLEMQLEKNVESSQVLLRSIQWHPYKKQILHIDFQRVDSHHALHTKVPLHFLNAHVSPAIKLNNAVISHIVTELEISCLPSFLPKFIEVDLSNITIGTSIYLSDIKLPIGVVYTHGNENPILASAVVSTIIEDDLPKEKPNK